MLINCTAGTLWISQIIFHTICDNPGNFQSGSLYMYTCNQKLSCSEHVVLIECCFVGGYEDFSALYPFLRTQKIIYMPRVRQC